MKNKTMWWQIVICVFGIFVCLGGKTVDVHAQEADLVITNAREMSEFAKAVSNGNKYEGKLIVLANDIVYDSISINNYSPVGLTDRSIEGFSGTFDGRGYAISGIDVTDQTWAALFVKVSSSGVVKNVTVAKSQFKGSYVAGIAANNYGTIQNCAVVECTFDVSSQFGGIAGYNSGTILNCYTYHSKAKGSIFDAKVGGIVGEAGGGTIRNCCNQSDLEMEEDGSHWSCMGGIVGSLKSGANTTVENCYNSGNVTLNGSTSIGGIAGVFYSGNIIAHCYTATGASASNFGINKGTERDNKAKTDAELRSADFVNLLNANRGSHSDWAAWEIRSESVYPLPVKPASIHSGTIQVAGNVVYHGEACTPEVTVVVGGKTLVQGTDYEVVYANNINAGKAVVTASGIGLYYGELRADFTIEKAAQVISYTRSYKKAVNGRAFYINAAQKTGDGRLTYTSSKSAVASVDNTGKITPKKIGKTVVTVTASETGNYRAASVKIVVTIKPAKVSVTSATRSGSGLSVKWKKDSKVQGYQLQYSTDAKFKKNVKTVVMKKNGRVHYRIKKIRPKSTYYVRVRSYKDGIYGSWSKKKKIG